MNSNVLRWLSGGIATLMLASVAVAEPADSNNTEEKSSQTGTEQPASNSENTPSDNASSKASKTTNQASKKAKNKRKKRKLRLGRFNTRNLRLNGKQLGRSASKRLGAASKSSAKNTASGTGSTADQAGGNGSAGGEDGSAVQGNLPSQKENQTENNQNNSQNNKNINVTGAQAFLGLVNVNVSNVSLNVYKLLDVHNVLNNSQVELLTQKIQNSPGAQAKQDILNNLLQGSHILNKNKVAVGVLSDMKRVLTMSKAEAEKRGISP
jgi:hypothetical protein